MTVMLLLPIAFAVAFIGGLIAVMIHMDRRRRRHTARLQRVRGDAIATVATPTLPRKDRQARSGLFARIEAELERTSLRTRTGELVLQVTVGTLALYLLLVLLLGMNPLLALPLALLAPPALAVLVLRAAQARYLVAFNTDLPEALDVFARGLRAGRPVSDSLSIVVETSKGAIRKEFSRCYDETRMGATLPESLSRLQTRVPTPEVSFFAVATSLQTETGGNLIETMEGLAHQLRERRKLRKKARALTSEARASALILAALPFAVAFILALLNWQYLAPLALDTRGQVMSVAALTSIGLGMFIMARMGKLDV
ncbi:type II secretion system F family protein [Thalassorhabdomicrobium marinisediminis]|uniref:Pilus assembly protein TadB n=1 Tax=Thalassorhabdomicrobium marinisediminis TaxID=2170577 RepID=A0A2T7FX55_9RHOB|nr:type II secretion system F family protein [Thalassorhabdomicrobium marinisediminis]PVA06762.1 pilus assembly protein TadB [Thalassorhabdomicrobium marinisediminis]